MNQEKMDAVVFKLCDIAPLSKGEIAHLIDRGTQQTTNVLRRLMDDERVQYLHPETPSHPNQKYVSSQSDLFSK